MSILTHEKSHSLVVLNNSHPIASYVIESSGNTTILSTLNPKKNLLNFEWDMKFYFIHMKSDGVGTTLKHPKTMNGNVKNLNKRIEKIR
jgi:hypothetical protein